METEDKKEEDIVVEEKRVNRLGSFPSFLLFLRANDCLLFRVLIPFCALLSLLFFFLIPSSLDPSSSSSHTPSCFVGNERDREMRWTRMRRERFHS